MEFEQLLAYCRAEGRICPTPQAWNRLWQMLPERTRVGNGWSPPAPLILTAWHGSDDGQKRKRFAEHLAWARDHDALSDVSAMLLALEEADWHSDRRQRGA